MCERNGVSAQGSLVRRRGRVVPVLTVLEVETSRLEARAGRGAVWAAATTSLRNWDREKWGRGRGTLCLQLECAEGHGGMSRFGRGRREACSAQTS